MKGEKKEEMIKGENEIELKLKSKGRMSERGGKEKGKIIKKNLKHNDFFFFSFFQGKRFVMEKKERKGRSFDSFLTIFSSFLEGESLLKD